ncbi:MAG: hypothetical protein V2A77_05060 [Pseudomonadota bacterium]
MTTVDREFIEHLPNPFAGYRLSGIDDLVRAAEERGYERFRQDALQALGAEVGSAAHYQQQVNEGDW